MIFKNGCSPYQNIVFRWPSHDWRVWKQKIRQWSLSYAPWIHICQRLENMLADNQLIVFWGAHSYRLKLINKQPPSIAMDRFYAMSQAVVLKALPRALSIGGGLIVCGILASHSINDNNIIYGILDGIPISSSLWLVVKKSHEAAFMQNVEFSASVNV